MRLVAALLTLVILGAAGLAGQMLYQELQTPPTAPVQATLQTVQSQPTSSAVPPRQWPALFGEPQPPAPPASEPQPPAPEPQPPAPSMPPLDSLGYGLKGVVRINDNDWAIVSHPTGERLVRVGDVLQEGLIVTRIDDVGLWVSANGAAAELLGFEE